MDSPYLISFGFLLVLPDYPDGLRPTTAAGLSDDAITISELSKGLSGPDKNPDMPPGQSGGFNNANYAAVYYGAGIQGFYGHIQQKSLKVKAGDKVKTGQPLALVGNSGASGAPHLHFTMTDMSSFSVKGRFTYEVRRGTKWLQINARDLPPNQIVRNWDPPAETQ